MGDVTYIDPLHKQVTTVTEGKDDALHCLLITLTSETIVLPNSAVAEVIAFTRPEPLEGSPEWFLGRITWRERKVPLISFGLASVSGETSVERSKGDRIAILNTINGNPDMPYIAIVSQGIPSLSVVHRDDISTIESNPQGRQSVAEIVSIAGQTLVIPDIDNLESRLKNLHA